MAAKIEIGGPLALERLHDLLEEIEDDRGRTDWNGDVPETFEEIFELTNNPNPLTLYHDVADDFANIEKFCRKHRLSYRRRTETSDTAETENHCVVWQPGMAEPQDYLCMRDGTPLLVIDSDVDDNPLGDRRRVTELAAIAVPPLVIRPGPAIKLQPAHSFSDRELAAVLAGLRFLQRHVSLDGSNTLPSDIDDVFQTGGTVDALNPPEIDDLCERLNVSRKAE